MFNRGHCAGLDAPYLLRVWHKAWQGRSALVTRDQTDGRHHALRASESLHAQHFPVNI